jgi:hypothetical protein
MLITQSEYNLLTEQEQADLLRDFGEFLLYYEDTDYTFLLFSLFSFFVEVVTNNSTLEIIQRRTFRSTVLLHPYLNQFQINDLF